MCLAKEESKSPQKEVQSPRSPWMKLLNRQSSKPRLPRKGTTSTRVNLNKCWSKLGELISNSSPRTDLPSHKTAYLEEPVLVPFSEYFYPLDPVKPVPVEDNDNAENQNILNSSRFQLISEEEISDNMANEVREICYTANKTSCFQSCSQEDEMWVSAVCHKNRPTSPRAGNRTGNGDKKYKGLRSVYDLMDRCNTIIRYEIAKMV